MPRTVEKLAYKYDELEPRAQERAREQANEWVGGDTIWAENVVEMFAEDLSKDGTVDFTMRTYQTMGGKTGSEPCIYWEVNYCQGDGAAFEGRIYIAAWLRRQKLASKYRALYHYCTKIADHWASVSSGNNGLYIKVDVENDLPDGKAGDQLDALAGDIQQWARDQASELYKNLRAEWEYQTSEEVLIEMIEANDYDWNVNGTIFR